MTSSEADLQLLNDARAWAAQDPDPRTAATLTELVKLTEAGTPAARQDLEDSFRGTLQFGTAGLRAALGPGPNRMNRVVVRRAAAGFANFLVRTVAEAAPGTRPRAVVGYDARYNSDIFATETAAVFTAAGIETFLMPAALPDGRYSGTLLAGAILAGAGLYQFSSLKRACLTLCQRPFPFFFTRWTNEPRGVFRLGLLQGLYCLGCCWAMMLALFAVGAMNAVWMAALGVVMTVEKMTATPSFARAVGLAFVAAGLWLMMSELV